MTFPPDAEIVGRLEPSLSGYQEQLRHMAAERIAKGKLLPPSLAYSTDDQLDQSCSVAVLEHLPLLWTYQLTDGTRLELQFPEPKGSFLDLWV